MQKKSNLILKYPDKGLSFKKLLIINIFLIVFMFFLFIKQGKSVAISLYFAITVILVYLNNDILKRIAKVLRTIPGSSKHFFEIFPNFIWESSLNIYYLDTP